MALECILVSPQGNNRTGDRTVHVLIGPIYGYVVGFGGQVDFIRGAGEGYDGKGKPIIAMASMSPRGVSKIVPVIKEGMVSYNLSSLK